MYTALKSVQNLKSYARKKTSNFLTFQFFEFCAKKMYLHPKPKLPQNESSNAGLSNGIIKNGGPVWHRGRKFSPKLVHAKVIEKWLSGNWQSATEIKISSKCSPNAQLSNGTIKKGGHQCLSSPMSAQSSCMPSFW